MSTITEQAAPVTISGHLLEFAELRDARGEWTKAHDTASATASRDAKAKMAEDRAGRQLDADMASGVRETSNPKDRAEEAGLDPRYFGRNAQTSVVTFGNGRQWVRKRGLPDQEMRREMLASRVSDVLGAGAPHVIIRDQETWQPFILDAQPAAARLGSEGGDDRMINSTLGAKIGILDTITGNADRHPGNWMVQRNKATGEERPVPIDHGKAMMNDAGLAEYGGMGAFGQPLFGKGRESERLAAIPAEAWDQWTDGVESLAPQFKAAGMARQWNTVLTALGTAAIVSAEAKKQMPHVTGQPFHPDDPGKWMTPP
jgi:hypothetical protein